MHRQEFGAGFTTGAILGAIAGLGGLWAFKAASADTDRRIVRLEKGINVGRPVEEVFAAWSDFERLPRLVGFLKSIEGTAAARSRWTVHLDGKDFSWDAQITQIAPNQSIGWKSVRGPKHTGRISFAPLQDQTVVHVTMNYAPPLGDFGAMLPIEHHLEHWIDRGLREFKAALEGGSVQSKGAANEVTGKNWSSGPVGVPGEHAAPGTVEYTRPPEAGY